MAALTAARKITDQYGAHAIPDIGVMPVKAAVVCYAGGLAVLNGGFAAPGTTATGLIALGRFEETVDNTAGSNGTLSVRFRRGAFKFDNGTAGDAIAQANVGADCYVIDDHTVALTSNSGARSRAGKIIGYDSVANQVTVLLGIGL